MYIWIYIYECIYFYIFVIGVHPDYKCKNLTDAQLENFTLINNENHVVYEECNIEVYSDTNSTSSTDSFTCLNGYEYTPSPERSIISEVSFLVEVSDIPCFRKVTVLDWSLK